MTPTSATGSPRRASRAGFTLVELLMTVAIIGLAAVISPIAMTFFLTKVTGASLNEKGMKSSKPGYEDYVRRTSGFIPLPPRRG